MDQEKEEKKKTTTKKKSSTSKAKTTTSKAKTTTKKETTKKETAKKTTSRKKKVEEVVIPYNDELSTVVEKEYKEEEITPEQLIDEVADAITTPVVDLMNGEFHKKPSNWIYAIVGIFIIFMIVVCIYSYFHQTKVVRDDHFTFLADSYEYKFDSSYVEIDNKMELLQYFPTAVTQVVDFSLYRYFILSVPYNPCSENDVVPVGYTLEDDIVHVQFTYTASCGGCAPQYLYYLFEIDRNTYFIDIKFDYEATNDSHCLDDIAYKPILYFYPEEETNISVKLLHEDFLTTTYPKYNGSWEYIAYPDGTLKDKNTNREYYSLFWEGDHHEAYVQQDGFVVKGEDTLSFLEEKLKVLGLTDKEAEEFIIYWLPSLEKNAYNYIRFETIEEINSYMPLDVQPTPDTIIRIQMDYKALNEKIDVIEQDLKTPERLGFTVVEWGGSIIKD